MATPAQEAKAAKEKTAADAKAKEAAAKADVAKKAAEKATADAEKAKQKALADAEKAKLKAVQDAAKAKEKADLEAKKLAEKAELVKQKEAAKAAKDKERADKAAAKLAEREARKNAPRVPRTKPWEDLQPGAVQKAPREGSVLHTCLELMKSQKGGATLAELNAAIPPKHDAQRLFRWANREMGFGFFMNTKDQKVNFLAPNLKVPTPAAPPAAK